MLLFYTLLPALRLMRKRAYYILCLHIRTTYNVYMLYIRSIILVIILLLYNGHKVLHAMYDTYIYKTYTFYTVTMY